ncbi:uncharacterized protein METZ01_LOCUS262762, partial [marine metagenome]
CQRSHCRRGHSRGKHPLGQVQHTRAGVGLHVVASQRGSQRRPYAAQL